MNKIVNGFNEIKFFLRKDNTNNLINLSNYIDYHFIKNKTSQKSFINNICIESNSASFPAFRDIFRDENYKTNLNGENLVVMDCGANIGCSAIYFATSYNNVKRIYCYEPVKENIEYLKKNINTNNLKDKIIIIQKGISNKNELVNFTIEGVTSHKTKGKGIKVELLNFDNEIKKIINKEGKLDLIKLDIEGAEKEILKKSKYLNKVKNLIIEIHPENKSEEIQMMESLQRNFKSIKKITTFVYYCNN